MNKIGLLLLCGLLSTSITAQEKSTPDTLSFHQDPRSKDVRMLRSHAGATSFQKEASESIADSVKRHFAPYFGINNPASELSVKKDYFPSVNRHNIRYQQQHQGIPIIGAELVANLKNQQLTSMSGEVVRIALSDLVADVTAQQATEIAKAAVAKWYQLDIHTLVATTPALTIYDPSLIIDSDAPQALTWKLNVSPAQLSPVNEFILVDANSGAIVMHYNQIDTVLNRDTYTANNTTTLPGTLVCNESDPTCAAGDTDAQNAHRYAADTYNFYFNNHGRDSLDDNGMTIISTVHYGPVGYQNAFWTGTQIGYGDGFSAADDVVAHELTHGVTTSTSNLFYYYQSGAINESLSDVWGEFVDLTNTSGTDTPAVRWQLGEDIPGIGAIRDMANPGIYGDPDRMTSANYYTGAADNGGVHINSGINNKAVTLMVDGGNFNNRNVSALGISKVAKIYYEVQTNYLTSGSDYLDLYNALNTACQSMIGTDGITSNDCIQVQNATEAVEMHLVPAADYNPEAEICPASSQPNDLLLADFEANLSGWTSSNIIGANSWDRASGYATSGTYSVGIVGTNSTHDTVLTLNNPVAIPASGTYYIHFNHAFDFEAGGDNRYDGGVIEYSINGGTTWQDAASLIDSGRQYNGTLFTGASNPLAGRQAFTATSHGYNSTRLNLSTLAGNNLRFRFRSTADVSVDSLFWVIDDFRIYSCTTNSPPMANAGAAQTVNANSMVNLNGNQSTDPEGDTLTYQWTQTGGATVILNNPMTASPSFTSPGVMSMLIFRLQVTDTVNQTDTDTVTITVNGPPTADAGSAQTVNVNDPISLVGNGNDPEGGQLTYSWVQTAGTSVTLVNANMATATFMAPASADTLAFRLIVTDNRNQTATDTVTITVQTPVAAVPPGGGSSGCSFNPHGRFDPIWVFMLILFSLIHLRRRQEN